MAEMTKARWDELSGKGQWDIMVALRGPDSMYGETLKWFTTSVIRGHMRGVFRIGGLINTDLKAVVLPAGDSGSAGGKFDAAGKYGWNYHHFCEHVATAAQWMKIPTLYVEAEVWHKAMSKGSTLNAAETIIKEAEAFNEKVKGEGSFGKYFYASAPLEELKRHVNEGRLY